MKLLTTIRSFEEVEATSGAMNSVAAALLAARCFVADRQTRDLTVHDLAIVSLVGREFLA